MSAHHDLWRSQEDDVLQAEKSGDRTVMVTVPGAARPFDGEKGSKKKSVEATAVGARSMGKAWKEGCSTLEGLAVEVLEACYLAL